MGGCLSSTGSPSKPYILSSSGGEKEYHERYHESKTLGQGEFGTVKLAHDVKTDDGGLGSLGLAVKIVKKGFTFKDNTLYTPLKKEALVAEVEILRRLAGQCYNLRLVDVYESNSLIYIITEYCEGGMMMSWVTKAFGGAGGGNNNTDSADGLRTEDVSRISYQLWSALAHCAKHNVIHRDIKPDNIMFCTSDKDSQLRLIDFGSGSLDQSSDATPETNSIDHRHHTFAGSGFYISPEMYQREYTYKTDIWSAGTTLYVLVAGYPADQLQETFDLLQSFDSTNNNIKVSGGSGSSSATTAGRIRKLPNLPANLPDSFYDMLEGALCYAPNKRMDASQLLQCEMAQFHIQHELIASTMNEKSNGGRISISEVVADAAAAAGYDDNIIDRRDDDGESEFMALLSSPSSSMKPKRTMSVLLEGSVNRHNVYLGYQKFERSVTTVLATMLARDTCQQ